MTTPDTQTYFSYLAATVMQPSPQNMRELLDAARLCGIGAHEATADYQALVAAESSPSDDALTKLARGEEDAIAALTAAKTRAAEAQAELDAAEASAINAKQRHLEARSARLIGDRAKKRPSVKAALATLNP